MFSENMPDENFDNKPSLFESPPVPSSTPPEVLPRNRSDTIPRRGRGRPRKSEVVVTDQEIGPRMTLRSGRSLVPGIPNDPINDDQGVQINTPSEGDQTVINILDDDGTPWIEVVRRKRRKTKSDTKGDSETRKSTRWTRAQKKNFDRFGDIHDMSESDPFLQNPAPAPPDPAIVNHPPNEPVDNVLPSPVESESPSSEDSSDSEDSQDLRSPSPHRRGSDLGTRPRIPQKPILAGDRDYHGAGPHPSGSRRQPSQIPSPEILGSTHATGPLRSIPDKVQIFGRRGLPRTPVRGAEANPSFVERTPVSSDPEDLAKLYSHPSKSGRSEVRVRSPVFNVEENIYEAVVEDDAVTVTEDYADEEPPELPPRTPNASRRVQRPARGQPSPRAGAPVRDLLDSDLSFPNPFAKSKKLNRTPPK